MKNRQFLWGAFGVALALGLALTGCDNSAGSTSAPASYTVTFDGGDGSGAPPAAQTVESGRSVTMPGKGSLIAPAGKEFDGWRGDGQTLAAGDSYTVTRDTTFIAQWKVLGTVTPTNPFIGGVWIDWDENTNYKFVEVSGEYVYSTAATNTFNIAGTYTWDADRKEITLRPSSASPMVKTYEITKSLLIFDKDKAGEKWLTKNPETGGGFNGSLGAAPVGGIWQNTADTTDVLGFNSDYEYFIISNERNKDGKYWWDVYGSYQYDSTRKELTLRHNGIDGQTSSVIYTVEFTTANQVMELIERDGTKTTFNKRDNL